MLSVYTAKSCMKSEGLLWGKPERGAVQTYSYAVQTEPVTVSFLL